MIRETRVPRLGPVRAQGPKGLPEEEWRIDQETRERNGSMQGEGGKDPINCMMAKVRGVFFHLDRKHSVNLISFQG